MTTLVRSEDGAVFNLSQRSKFRLSGTDCLRYLNGQITNDVRKASADAAIHACVPNAKGRINADVYIARDGDAFVLDAEEEVRETLAARLEKYVIADDVQIEDVTEHFALFHMIGGNVPEIADVQRRVAAQRFGLPGRDLWLERSRQQGAVHLPICDSICAETFRIERGIPRSGRELTEEIIPIEANLEAETVDYAKGCYIGQEVISRIKMSGQTNKRLRGLVSVDGGALAEGTRLVRDDKDAGWITSATYSTRLGKNIALGFVKRGFNEVGAQLHANGRRVAVAELPFV